MFSNSRINAGNIKFFAVFCFSTLCIQVKGSNFPTGLTTTAQEWIAEITPTLNNNQKREWLKKWGTYFVTNTLPNYAVRAGFERLGINKLQNLVNFGLFAKPENAQNLIFTEPLLKEIVIAALTGLLTESGERTGLIGEDSKLAVTANNEIAMVALESLAENFGDDYKVFSASKDKGFNKALCGTINELLVQELAPTLILEFLKTPEAQKYLGANIDEQTAVVLLTKYILPKLDLVGLIDDNSKNRNRAVVRSTNKSATKIFVEFIKNIPLIKKGFMKIEQVKNKNLRDFLRKVANVYLNIHTLDKVTHIRPKLLS